MGDALTRKGSTRNRLNGAFSFVLVAHCGCPGATGAMRVPLTHNATRRDEGATASSREAANAHPEPLPWLHARRPRRHRRGVRHLDRRVSGGGARGVGQGAFDAAFACARHGKLLVERALSRIRASARWDAAEGRCQVTDEASSRSSWHEDKALGNQLSTKATRPDHVRQDPVEKRSYDETRLLHKTFRGAVGATRLVPDTCSSRAPAVEPFVHSDPGPADRCGG